VGKLCQKGKRPKKADNAGIEFFVFPAAKGWERRMNPPAVGGIAVFRAAGSYRGRLSRSKRSRSQLGRLFPYVFVCCWKYVIHLREKSGK